MCITIPFSAHRRELEFSVIEPSGLPKKIMPSTVLHSVVYIIPKSYNDMFYLGFLKALGEAFPIGKAFGLLTKIIRYDHIVEMVLATDKDCESALKVPISFELGKKSNHSYHATATVHPSLDVFRIDLSKIPLESFDTLKTVLVEAFSKYGTVLDIVLYREDASNVWFMGNGYIIISRKKNTYNRTEDPLFIDLGFPYFEETELKWSKVE